MLLKKKNLWIGIVVALLILAIAGYVLYENWFHENYVEIGEVAYDRYLTVLDLSGMDLPDVQTLTKFYQLQELNATTHELTTAEYEQLRNALPNCRILWTVPFQGQRFDEHVQELTATQFSESDVQMLKYFPSLKSIEMRDSDNYGLIEQLQLDRPDLQISYMVRIGGKDYQPDIEELSVENPDIPELLQVLPYLHQLKSIEVHNARDYGTLEKLQSDRPDLQISYMVHIGGKDYQPDIEELAVENPDIPELKQTLPYMHQLKTVYLTGQLPENDAVYELMQLREDVVFHWNVTLFGVQTSSTATELILNDIPMENTDAVENALKYFYNLQRVEMCNCGIPSEQMDALWKRHPEIRFIWIVNVGLCRLRTDVTVLMPYKFGHSYPNFLEDKDMGELKYCVDLICLDLGHMYISDYSFLAYMPKLQYLILADTLGDDFSLLKNLKDLVYLELFMSDFNQPEVLTELTKLEDLNVSFTKLDNVEPLLEMTWLKRLWLVETDNVTEEEQEALEKALPNTRIQFYGKDSLEGGWRTGYLYYKMRDLLGMHYMP